VKTDRVDIADVGEVHVVLGELLEDVVVMDRFGTEVLVPAELGRAVDCAQRKEWSAETLAGQEVLLLESAAH
jgi:hypothetical protein